MFDRIAPRYDLLNTVLSGGADARWRRRAARETGLGHGGSALDVACGSGKLTRELARLAGAKGRVVGLDFSEQMLVVAGRAGGGPVYERGDALALPYGDGTFDAATMAFGLRNLADPRRGLAEMLRVLRPGGRAVVLEFLKPPATLAGRAYRVHLRHVLPWLGGVISGSPPAYRYLSDTVDSYRTAAELRDLARSAGWGDIRQSDLALGAVGIMSGQRE